MYQHNFPISCSLFLSIFLSILLSWIFFSLKTHFIGNMWVRNSCIFYFMELFLWCSILKNILTLHRIPRWWLLFKHFKRSYPFVFWLLLFLFPLLFVVNTASHPSLASWKVSLPLDYFLAALLWFINLWFSLCLSYMDFIETLKLWFMFTLENSLLLSKYFICNTFSFLFSNSNCTCVRSFCPPP